MESPLPPIQFTASKRERFRAEIRRKSLLSRFGEQRRQLVGHFQYGILKQLLGTLDTKQYPHPEQVQELIAILDDNCPNAEFNIQIGSQQLQQGFANILLTHGAHLVIPDKTRLLSALNYLTYYHEGSSEVLSNREQFIDYLRKEIRELKLENIEEVQFLQGAVGLLMNLSSLLRKDFNLYLAESDICKCIIQQTTRTYNISKHMHEEYRSSCEALRALTLRLLKNIIKALDEESLPLVINLVRAALQDEAYFSGHPEHTFWLLAEAMSINGFWPELMAKEQARVIEQVVSAADNIEMRCFGKEFLNNREQTLTDRQFYLFSSLLAFLNELFYEDDEDPNISLTWQIAVQNLLNGYMLAEFLFQAQRRRKKEDILIALRTYSLLSRSDFVRAKELIVVRPAQEEQALIKSWLQTIQPSFPEASSYCLTVIKNLILKDKNFHGILMEMNVLEPLGQILEHTDHEKALVGGIQLGEVLLSCEGGQDCKMASILEARGVVRRIEKLLDHSNRDVFQKAEMFNEQYLIFFNKSKAR